MTCLAPCPACNRHVDTEAAACPFCSAALPESFRCQARQRLRGRLSRAGLLAAGAALLGGLEACPGATHYGTTTVPFDGGNDTGISDGPVAIYGAAPPAFEQAPPENGDAPPAKEKT